MSKFFDAVKNVEFLHRNGENDALAVEYYFRNDSKNRHYVIFRNDQEFNSWFESYKDWDIVANRLLR